MPSYSSMQHYYPLNHQQLIKRWDVAHCGAQMSTPHLSAGSFYTKSSSRGFSPSSSFFDEFDCNASIGELRKLCPWRVPLCFPPLLPPFLPTHTHPPLKTRLLELADRGTTEKKEIWFHRFLKCCLHIVPCNITTH